jgi:replication factor C subunit 1
MRLRASGDREEIRQQYLPVLWNRLVQRLMEEGKDSVEHIIDLMDSYFLPRDDWDAIIELGLGPMDESQVKFEPQSKATFTRLYNQRSHPLPYVKADNVTTSKGLPKDKPDIEDAIDESDEEDVLGDEAKDDGNEEPDLKKDKYVKLPKKPAAQKGISRKGKRATKGKKNEEDDFIDNDEDDNAKPRKGRGRKSKGKA